VTGIDRRRFLTGALALGSGAALGRTARDFTIKRARPLRTSADRILDHPARESPIDTIVVVMLENRSFDHVLGWMATDEPYLEEGRRRFGKDFHVIGSTSERYRAPNGEMRATEDALTALGEDERAFRGCTHKSPGHSWKQGRIQRDQGFLAEGSGNDEFAVTYFDGKALPHHQLLAAHSTVCDRHFSSLLGPTFPNRMYMHAAQSEGHKGDPGPLKTGIYSSTTIWDLLERADVPATYYYTDVPILRLWGDRMAPFIAPIDQYFEQALSGTLPNVVMVDPSFTGSLRADGHPKGDVGVAAGFVAIVLEALLGSPQWDRSLFVVTFDEWGGFYDSVRPVKLADNRASKHDQNDFGQAGFRVPAAHVSSYAPGNAIDHTVYDHTSILRFIEWRFLGAPASGPGAGSSGRWWLTQRDRHANPIGQLLRTTPVNTDIPRPFVLPESVRQYVPDCAEDTTDAIDPFQVSPEFEELLALEHPPAGTRPWEQLGIPR
jgi:phospholipase C